MGIERCPDLRQDILNGGKPICPVCGESRSIWNSPSGGCVEESVDKTPSDGIFRDFSYKRITYRCTSCGWRWYKFTCW